MRTALRPYETVLLLVLLLAGPPACRRKLPSPPPDTKLFIISATWRAIDESGVADVTQKVRELVKDDALDVLASSNLFGDCAPFALKELRVDYIKSRVFAKKRAAENERLRIAKDERPVPIRLVVTKALYGNLASGRTVDVTKRVADMVVDNVLTVAPSNALFGDPASFKSKDLWVSYTFDGIEQSKTVGEGETLRLTSAQ